MGDKLHPILSLRLRAHRLRIRLVPLTDPNHYLVWRKVRHNTMLTPALVADNLRLCSAPRLPDGVVVECGTWKGGMSAAMALTLRGRVFHLFDSFGGLPEATRPDGDEAAEFLKTDRLVAAEASARTLMASTGEAFEVHTGWFDNTVPAFARHSPSIAVLRLDGDWYESTRICLEELFPLVAAGGLVIIDDYDHWVGCRRAVHEYLWTHQRDEAIQRTRFGVVYLEKTTSTQCELSD